jgi:clan AA aspartic protease (TIGR02281 family)
LKKENNWINDTSWIYGKANDNIIRSAHPTYIRIDGNGSLLSKENDFGAQFYLNRFVMPLPNFNLRDAKKTFEGKSVVNIPLKKLGNSYYVKLFIGGIGYDFLFDTGASDFLINKKIEKNLINAGIIRKEDYLENETYEIADGSKVEMRRVKIAKLKFGSIYLENIVAGISETNTQPLFGISALNKFQTWKINNKTNILSIKR